MNSQTKSTRRNWLPANLLVFYGFAAFTLMLFGYVVYAGRMLRPAADDYCLAVDAHLGVVGGTLYWFEYLSGYLTSIAAGMAFVGWPLLNLTWGLGSLIPFLLAGLLVSGLLVLTLRLTLGRGSKKLVLLIPVGTVAWWTYLWLPQGYGADGFPRWMAYTLTHWQTNNGIYVVQTVLITSSCLILWKLKERRRWMRWMFAALGVIAGFCGPTVVVTLVTIALIALVYDSFTGSLTGQASRSSLALLAAGTTLGGIIAQFAPGSLARQERIGATIELSATRFAEIVQATVPEAIFIWFQSFAHGGAAATLLLSLSLGWLLARAGIHVNESKMTSIALLMAGASLTASLAARFTELFAYAAWWHFTPTWVLSFAVIFSAGLAGGVLLARNAYTWDLAVVSAALGMVAMLSVGSLLIATTGMAARLIEWNAGAAPIGSTVSDIQDAEGFERKCWNNLIQLRDAPNRGIDPLSIGRGSGAQWGSEGGSVRFEKP